jgi:HEAT repeat protein
LVIIDAKRFQLTSTRIIDTYHSGDYEAWLIYKVEKLIEFLEDEHSEVLRFSAAKAIVEIGEPAVEPLIGLLGDEDSNVRFSAAEGLGKIGDIRAVDPLILSLWDPEETVLQSVSQALDAINPNWAVGESVRKYLRYFSEALKKGNVPVKLFVIEVLEKTGIPSVSEILATAFESENRNVRLRAAKAIETIKDVGRREVE